MARGLYLVHSHALHIFQHDAYTFKGVIFYDAGPPFCAGTSKGHRWRSEERQGEYIQIITDAVWTTEEGVQWEKCNDDY